MGVGMTYPNCRFNFAFICSNCNSVETEIYESFELANYFQTRSLYYLKCRLFLFSAADTIIPKKAQAA